MTTQERDVVYETVDILRALGGHNGFSNLQPRVKKVLLKYANRLKEIADRDVSIDNSMQNEEFDGEIIYES